MYGEVRLGELDSGVLNERHTAAGRVEPVNDPPCGPLGLASRPSIHQLFVNAPAELDEAVFDRALFRARRRAEVALVDDAAFYVVSLSAATIGYKAMAAIGGGVTAYRKNKVVGFDARSEKLT